MRRSAWNGGYVQPQPTTPNCHRTHSEHVTKVADRPCHAGGAVQHRVVVHKESFEEVDGGQQARCRFDDSYPTKANTMAAAAAEHHGGGSSHRYETCQETYEENFEEETYSAGRHHGRGRRQEYHAYEETYGVEKDKVMGVGGCAQLKGGYRGA